ncbi:Tropomodulin [Halotydeus destructor]|nr:Tropomodulin [Halotydeus destructor]
MSQDYDEFEFEYTKITKTTRVVNPKAVTERKQSGGIGLLYGKDLSEYANIPIEDLLNQLTEAELEELTNEVDPDDPHIPPSMRCKEQTKKGNTGPLDRAKLLTFLRKYASEQEDWPENKPFAAGTKRGKVFVPKEEPEVLDDGERVILDVEEEEALGVATDADLVDLAGIIGLHSMLNQDQYYAAITNKGQAAANFQSIVKAPTPKIVPMLPDNDTDVSKTAQRVADNDPTLKELNWNNIKHIPRDLFKKLFEGLKGNTKLEKLSLSNTGLTDSPASKLVEALKDNKSLTVLNLESNFVTGPMIRNFFQAINQNQTVLEFRAANQRPQILGNRVEMEVAKLVEQNDTLLRLGLNFDVPDARMRIAQRLQDNNDNVRLRRIGRQTSQDA